MDLSSPKLAGLFDQLGLASEPASIMQFVEMHSPLPTSMLLADAPFWTSTQATFLREEILNDADWAPVIDQLNVRLHSSLT